MRKIVIAIDGFSSCGKSTFAKRVATMLGYVFIDTGAMYRGVTLYGIEQGLIVDGVVDRAWPILHLLWRVGISALWLEELLFVHYAERKGEYALVAIGACSKLDWPTNLPSSRLGHLDVVADYSAILGYGR